MVNLNSRPTRLGVIAARFSASGSIASGGSWYGGTITAGTADASGSALLTFDPFMSAPICIGTYENFGARTANITQIAFTGVGVSNVYVNHGCTPASRGQIHVTLFGEVKL